MRSRRNFEQEISPSVFSAPIIRLSQKKDELLRLRRPFYKVNFQRLIRPSRLAFLRARSLFRRILIDIVVAAGELSFAVGERQRFNHFADVARHERIDMKEA